LGLIPLTVLRANYSRAPTWGRYPFAGEDI
jgi:hypothetical protein